MDEHTDRASEQTDDLTQWVDPHIGAIAHLLAPTIPTLQRPNGMVRLAPNRTQGHPDPWLGDHIVDFPLNILSHRGARAFALMARSGDATGSFASEADHDFERVTPFSYEVLLEDSSIEAFATVSEHAMIYRFRFTQPGWGHVLLRARGQGGLEALPGGQELRGWEQGENITSYFYARFSRTFERSQVEQGEAGASACLSFAFDAVPQEVEVRIGFSYVGLEQARRNLDGEVGGRSFVEVAEAGRAAWNATLQRIMVVGGTEREKRIFYTALWRSHERPVNIDEGGQYFSAYDRQVHAGTAEPFYVDDWLWDTFRSLHPLRLILEPQRESAILASFARMVEQGGGWAPVFPLVDGNHGTMIGNHAAAVTADAWCKGLRSFDVATLYAGLRKNAMQGSRIPWYLGPATELDQVYLEQGFFPALAPGQAEWVPQVHPYERRQSVSVTLDHAYDDWCLGELAAALGKAEDAALFRQRALNYRKLYRADLGVMAPRTADGGWVEPFDAELGGGQGGRDYYAENNGWVWTWNVPHDPAGLIELMGGRERFCARLDELFNAPLSTSKWHFMGQFPDATGLTGQFPMGNEPAFLIPYLYLYGGMPWRTQKRVRQMMQVWFDDDPLGICGDDDGGALSSWYVFSALGFYPLCPGRPVYGIGSPIFERAVIRLGTGGQFTLSAPGASRRNKYVQSARLNGRVLERAWFEHRDLVDGGSLELVMGPRPNRSWGTRPEDAPPSLG